MDPEVRQRVRERAGHRCEYCQLAERHSPVSKLQIEHIVPRKHGGSDDLDNLALACIDCNLHKGSNLTGIDPNTGQVIELFNPRRQRWPEHFAWNRSDIAGLSATGRTTIRVMDLNSEDRIRVRLATMQDLESPE